MFHLFSFNGPFNTVLSVIAILIIVVYTIEAVRKFRSFSQEPSGTPRVKKFWEGCVRIVLCLVFLAILSGIATIRDNQNTATTTARSYASFDELLKTKNSLLYTMKHRDSVVTAGINDQLINYTTFGDVYGLDSAGRGLKPLYLYRSEQQFVVDSAGNLSPDTNYTLVKTTAIVPAVYLGSTGGNVYTTPSKIDTVDSDMADGNKVIRTTYQLVLRPAATVTSIAKETKAEKQLVVTPTKTDTKKPVRKPRF